MRLAAGSTLIIDVVFIEASVRFPGAGECSSFLGRRGVTKTAISPDALWLAGQAFRRYRRCGGAKTNMLPDFFLGAQAEVAGLPILTREASRYRADFPDVALIEP